MKEPLDRENRSLAAVRGLFNGLIVAAFLWAVIVLGVVAYIQGGRLLEFLMRIFP